MEQVSQRNSGAGIEIFSGSPRKNGNTSMLINALTDALILKGIPVSTTWLYDSDIRPCIDCRACKSGDMNCTTRDDGQILYDKLEAATAIVFATPVYWFGPTAKTKLLIDRLRPYYGNRKLRGKKGAVLLVAGSGDPDCDLTLEMFRRIFDALGISFAGSVTAKAYDIGDLAGMNDFSGKVTVLSEQLI